MVQAPLGKTGLRVSPIGFGAFKIGRNQNIKYPQDYALPSGQEVARLLDGLLELGVNLIDTAPAYGVSEERIGAALRGRRRDEYVLATKVGERFAEGKSSYDFSGPAVRQSVEESLRKLRTEAVDLLFIHSDGRDVEIQTQTDIVPTLLELKKAGKTRGIGLSGKTAEGAQMALAWADAIAVEYHLEEQRCGAVMAEAARQGVGVVVKKGLASGHLDAQKAVEFVLGNAAVGSLLVGTLNLEHMRQNIAAAEKARGV
ncbi:MAG: aldo/keto reductase [Phycisphaeraceae bacterium]|nr:aldo/keto reductase [Phycisphaeraceae bacterium]